MVPQPNRRSSVQSGYSFGASSYSGGSEKDLKALDEELYGVCNESMDLSVRSAAIGLTTLNQEIKEQGDIVSTVVRFEVSRLFGCKQTLVDHSLISLV